MKTKILHLIVGLKTGGAERMLQKLVLNMNNGAFEQKIITLTSLGPIGVELRKKGFEIFELNMRKDILSLFKVYGEIKNIIGVYTPDVVVPWMYHSIFLTVVFKRIFSKDTRFIWNIRHTIYDLKHEKIITTNIIKFLIKHSTIPQAIIYNSEESRKSHEKLGYHKSNGKVLLNGFDSQIFKPTPYLINSEYFVIGIVARYHPLKDYPTFLEAASIFVKKNLKTRFVMVGRGVDRCNTELMDLIKKYNLENHVDLRGERKDIERIITNFNVFTLSSYSESFPNVLGEAMLCGVPCVSTDVGMASDIVSSYGLIVDKQEPFQIADAWEKLMNLDIASLKALKVGAREHIIENYSIQKIAKEYERILLD
ncbi:glycosyltransferase [Priestia koreensis]|uniref:glycosyltransferase n=1 Tax=Priestia koreensis TaxID=284581 RepID=UPI001F59C0FF|nr:glycosyltransferase [Priestia koreensis]UNL85798.1 glycosyltransferase [Priestia koreensis]